MSYAQAGLGRAAAQGLGNFGRQLMELSLQEKASEEREERESRQERQWQAGQDLAEARHQQSMVENAGAKAERERIRTEREGKREWDRGRDLATLLERGYVDATIKGNELLPGKLDPTASASYLGGRAEADAEFGDVERKARLYTGMGFTPTGARLQGPTGTPREDMILVNGRYFPNTAEGQAEALTWREQTGEAGREVDPKDAAMKALLAGLGGDEETEVAGVGGLRTQPLEAQETDIMLPEVRARPPPGREFPAKKTQDEEYDEAYNYLRDVEKLPHVKIVERLGPRPGG
ncbi:MAG: hypothetical protein KAJ55_00385 [Anaerolineales bacterium]|nr:hypothetical protein [Anaerolineales bacterium]